jgi:hypothetical protein
MDADSDESIIEMLCSPKNREREQATRIFIRKYESRVKNWVRKQSIKTDPHDIWSDSASLMIHAIQSGKYKKYESIELYTYFHYIVKSTWLKSTKNTNKSITLTDEFDTVEQHHEDFKPDIFTELNQHKSFVKDCLEKFDDKTQQLLVEIIVEDARLIDIFEELGLKNYNNAKQKYFKSKNTLISCLKKHMGYGK